MKTALVFLPIILFALTGCERKPEDFYNIRVVGDGWKKENFHLPIMNSQSRFIETVQIPHLYQLERKKYLICIEVNPKDHGYQTILQISIVRRSDSENTRDDSTWDNCDKLADFASDSIYAMTKRTPDPANLRADSTWEGGSCARIGTLADLVTDDAAIWFTYFTRLESVGFLWFPPFCIPRGSTQSPEQASAFPIMLKIYDQNVLIGEERIDFEIFQNGSIVYTDYP